MWKVWNSVMGVILALAIVLACLFAGVRLFGLNPYVVLSGSMEPEYHTGSLIYVRKTDYRNLKPGDVITFMMGDSKTIVTHRIVKVVEIPSEDDPTAKKFQTKGDRNDSADNGAVHYRNIIGEPVFSIPWLGRFYFSMKDHWGITLTVGLLLILMFFVPDIYGAAEKSRKKKEAVSEAPPLPQTPEEEPADTAEDKHGGD